MERCVWVVPISDEGRGTAHLVPERIMTMAMPLCRFPRFHNSVGINPEFMIVVDSDYSNRCEDCRRLLRERFLSVVMIVCPILKTPQGVKRARCEADPRSI